MINFANGLKEVQKTEENLQEIKIFMYNNICCVNTLMVFNKVNIYIHSQCKYLKIFLVHMKQASMMRELDIN